LKVEIRLLVVSVGVERKSSISSDLRGRDHLLDISSMTIIH
jgi:hypothetical protein